MGVVYPVIDDQLMLNSLPLAAPQNVETVTQLSVSVSVIVVDPDVYGFLRVMSNNGTVFL